MLSYQPAGGGRAYTEDYVLVVDTGSHNTFANNAGGNMIDIWRGPPGQGAAIVAPARGCIDAFDIIRAQTCVPAAAALLDTGSDNVFGVKTAPDPATDGTFSGPGVTGGMQGLVTAVRSLLGFLRVTGRARRERRGQFPRAWTSCSRSLRTRRR